MAAPHRFLFRLLVAVRLSRVAEDRGAGGEARPRRRLASRPARRRVQADRHGAADDIPLKGDYSRRDMERSARFHGIAEFRMPSRFPIPTQAPARIVLWQKAARPRACDADRAWRCTAPSSSTTSTSPTPTPRPRSRRRAGVDAAGGARGDRRSGDQGRAQARSRRRDRQGRLRLAVRLRRRRAVLGARPLRPGRDAGSRPEVGSWPR